MKLLALVLSLAAAAPEPVQDPVVPTIPPRSKRATYRARKIRSVTSLDARFHVLLPAGWGRSESPLITGPIQGPKEGDAALSITWEQTEVKGPLATAAADARLAIQQLMTDPVFAEDLPMTVGGRESVQMEVFLPATKSVLLRQLCLEEGTLVTFTFAADEKVFAKRWHEVNEILRSIRWFARLELKDDQLKLYADKVTEAFNCVRGGSAVEGLKAAQEALSISPRLGVPHFLIGCANALLRDHDKAVAAFKKAQSAETDNPVILWNLAKAYCDGAKDDLAFSALRRVMDVDPENDEAYLAAGQRYLIKKRNADARAAYQRGASHCPDSIPLLVAWAQCAELCERPKEALDIYEKILALDSTHGMSRQAVERLKKNK